jgi:hypothetical protein
MSENRVQRRIFVPRRDDVTRGGRKLYYDDFYNLYSSVNKIGMIKPKRMKWTGHVARMGRKRIMHRGFLWESQKERDD